MLHFWISAQVTVTPTQTASKTPSLNPALQTMRKAGTVLGERLSRLVLVPSSVFSGKDSSVPVEEPKESVLHAHRDHRHRNSA